MKKVLYIFCIIFLMQTIFCVQPITKVIVPMAGLGTRLLPLTKAAPKSMVCLIDKPALHHVVDEALQSSIKDFCFIINDNDRQAIENYFSPDLILDAILREKKKTYYIDHVNTMLSQSCFTYVVQPEPIGLGHAVLLGKEFVGTDDFFCVMLPDNIIESNDPHMAQLIAIAQQYNASVITIEDVTPEQVTAYAVVEPKRFLSDNLVEVGKIIEKPKPEQVTYCLGQIGRHVLSSDVFASLAAVGPGVNGEIQLTDAVQHMIQNGKKVLAYKLQGKRYDIGNIRGLLETTVSLALHNPLYKDMLYEIFKRELSIK